MLSQSIRPIQPYVYFLEKFTSEECDSIIKIAQAFGPRPAEIGRENGIVDPKIRQSDVCWLHQQASTQWIFDRLASVSASIHAAWFPCEVTHFVEPLQLTHYVASPDGTSGHYDWHRDMGDQAMRTRKLSISVLLNSPPDFDGGQFELFCQPSPIVAQLIQGCAIAFPSYDFHRVTPVTRGERWSLVAWLHGPVWR